MNLRMIGMREVFRLETSAELEERGISDASELQPEQRKIYATLQIPGNDFAIIEILLSDLPAGATIGDEFTLEFHRVEKG